MRWLRRLHRLELRRLLGSLGSLGPLGSGTGLALGLARWRPGSEEAGCQEAAQHSSPRDVLDPRNSSYQRCVVSSRRRHRRTGVLISCTEKHDTAHGTGARGASVSARWSLRHGANLRAIVRAQKEETESSCSRFGIRLGPRALVPPSDPAVPAQRVRLELQTRGVRACWRAGSCAELAAAVG